MQMRLYAVAAVLVSCPAATLGQGCDPADLFETRVQYDAGIQPTSVAIGDLNNDGAADLALTSVNGGLSVLLNNCDGAFVPEVRYAAAEDGLSWVTIGDLDGDGWADLVATNSRDNTVSVLLNGGDGTFPPSVYYDVGGRPLAVAIADLDGDGDLDLVTANYLDDDISVRLNNGDGTFGARVDYGTANGPFSVALHDVDGDGTPDLTTACALASNVNVRLNNGDGTFGPRANYGMGGLATSVAMGDLNGDGAVDLATANLSTNDVSVRLNNGDGTFGPRADYATPNGPKSVAIGDFNSDGVPDLATANQDASSANRLSVLVGNGDGTFAPRASYNVGLRPVSVAMGDLNGDGALDVVTANDGGDNASVLLNRCVRAAISAQPSGLVLPAGGGVAEFGVVAGGIEPILYQWRRDGVDLVDGGGVSGATTPTLTVDATIQDVGAYDVVVTNPAGDTVSDPAFLAVRPNPCPADFDGDGSLTLFDFLAFQNAFVAGCP